MIGRIGRMVDRSWIVVLVFWRVIVLLGGSDGIAAVVLVAAVSGFASGVEAWMKLVEWYSD